MFFILSKILLFLLSPAFWVGLFIVWSFFTRREKRKKWFRIIAVILFVVFTNPWLFNTCVRAWQPSPVDLPKGKTYSAAILLGGMMMSDRFGRGYFGPDADRFIQATKLYHSGFVQRIVLSGGSGSLLRKEPMEADQLRQQLLMQGVPDSVIITENSSRNTFENAIYSKKIVDSLRLAAPYVVVTSSVHIPRAEAAFKKAGMDVIMYPAAYKQVDHQKTFDDYVVPSVGLLTNWNYFLKEVVGLTVYRWTGKA